MDDKTPKIDLAELDIEKESAQNRVDYLELNLYMVRAEGRARLIENAISVVGLLKQAICQTDDKEAINALSDKVVCLVGNLVPLLLED